MTTTEDNKQRIAFNANFPTYDPREVEDIIFESLPSSRSNQAPREPTVSLSTHHKTTTTTNDTKDPSQISFNAKFPAVDPADFLFSSSHDDCSTKTYLFEDKQSTHVVAGKPICEFVDFRDSKAFEAQIITSSLAPSPSPAPSNSSDKLAMSTSTSHVLIVAVPFATCDTPTKHPPTTTATIHVKHQPPDLSLLAKHPCSDPGSDPTALVDCFLNPFSFLIPICLKHNPPDMSTPVHCLRTNNGTQSTWFKFHPPDCKNIDYLQITHLCLVTNNKCFKHEPPEHQGHVVSF